MSKTFSLKLDDTVFEEMEKLLKKIKISHNAFINEAVDFYTKFQKRLLMQRQLKKESVLLRQEVAFLIKRSELLKDLPE